MIKISKLMMLLISMLFVGCQQQYSGKIPPRAINGVLDLSGWNFEKDGPVNLDGEWEFYWKKLLEEQNFEAEELPRKTGLITIPSVWNNGAMDGIKLGPDGYATFKLEIKNLAGDGVMALKIPEMGNAYQLWINQKKLASNGVVGTSKEAMIPLWLPQVVAFNVHATSHQLILHVSNYVHRHGGIKKSLILGENQQIQNIRERRVSLELFLFGSLLIMGLYHLGLDALRRKDPSALYFGFFCLLVAVRILTSGERLLVFYFEPPWELTMKLDSLGFYLAVPIFNLFIYSLFPGEFWKPFVKISLVLGGLFSLVVLLTPANIYTTYTLVPYQVIALIHMGYGFYVLGQAVFRKREGSLLFLLGCLILFFAMINDILYGRMMLHTGDWMPVAQFLFIFCQSLVLFKRFSKAFTVSEELSEKLEQKVAERTDELHQSLQITQRKEQEITHINQVVQVINSTLELDKVMESIMDALHEIFQFSAISIQLVNEAENRLDIYSVYGEGVSEDDIKKWRGLHISLTEDSISNYVLKSMEPSYFPDVTPELPMTAVDRKIYEVKPFSSYLAHPLVVHNKAIGVLCFFSMTKHFDLEDEDILKIQRYVTQIATSINNARLYEDLKTSQMQILVSNKKLEELDNAREQFLKKMNILDEKYFPSIKEKLNNLLTGAESNSKELVRQAVRDMHSIDEALLPFRSLFITEQAIQSKQVLLAETNKKQQIIAQMALGGTGVELDIVSDMEQGLRCLDEKKYDIICSNSELVELTRHAVEKFPDIKSVFMTSEDATNYLPLLKKYPFLSNIVSQNEEDRTFTLKNISTTISKLITNDLFGLEKYLNWGVDVHQKSIGNSEVRTELVDEMEQYFTKLGVRRPILKKCSMVVEELLMNAIYDAPVDAEGKSLYNHLPRTEKLELKPEEQATFRYACDGLLLAVSVEDPFGAFHRETILKYLASCYEGREGTLQQNKGGAGRGLFQIIETSDLVVFNVKPKVRTEVVVIFNIDPNKPKSAKTTSFHYFYG
ncbi:MAG: GAF domain-containing protein [SAR324 cluster bacterium]|nr:GAF domain-containing protein [SAR324 cluster bacterium]